MYYFWILYVHKDDRIVGKASWPLFKLRVQYILLGILWFILVLPLLIPVLIFKAIYIIAEFIVEIGGVIDSVYAIPLAEKLGLNKITRRENEFFERKRDFRRGKILPKYDEDEEEDADEEFENCSHIACVSISETEIQCMDCMRTWPKSKDFKSDWPEYDRG